MITIAICDDNSNDLNNIHNLTLAYAESHNIANFKITTYKSAEKLLSAIKSAITPVNLVFLDVIMPSIDGIQAGAAIKAISPQTEIVYLSMSDEFAIDSYSVNAFYYILKPVPQEKFFHIMDLYMDRVAKHENKYFSVKTHDGLVTCELKSIESGFLDNRQAHFVLTDGTLVTSTTIRGSYAVYLEELLQHDYFAMSSASDLVNLIHVEKLSSDNIMMVSKKNITLSRQHKKSFQEKFFNFYSK